MKEACSRRKGGKHREAAESVVRAALCYARKYQKVGEGLATEALSKTRLSVYRINRCAENLDIIVSIRTGSRVCDAGLDEARSSCSNTINNDIVLPTNLRKRPVKVPVEQPNRAVTPRMQRAFWHRGNGHCPVGHCSRGRGIKPRLIRRYIRTEFRNQLQRIVVVSNTQFGEFGGSQVGST